MKKRNVFLRFLCDRQVARKFRKMANELAAEQFGLHLQSVLAAAIANPTFVVSRIRRGGLLKRQTEVSRRHPKPVLLSVPCGNVDQRQTICRLLQALTVEVAYELGGPVLPDASTVFMALSTEWVEFSSLKGKGTAPQKSRRRRTAKRKSARTARESSSAENSSESRSKGRNKKPTSAAKPDWSKPHPDYPDVSATPIAWRPGKRGRPPRGAERRPDGSWIIPVGYRVIGGKVHPPLPTPKRVRFYQEQEQPTASDDRVGDSGLGDVRNGSDVSESPESARDEPEDSVRVLQPGDLLVDEKKRQAEKENEAGSQEETSDPAEEDYTP